MLMYNVTSYNIMSSYEIFKEATTVKLFLKMV